MSRTTYYPCGHEVERHVAFVYSVHRGQHKRTLAVSVMLSAGLVPSWSGCESRCDGPSCESTRTGTRIAVHQREGWDDEISVWEDATMLFDGTQSQGTSWSLAVADGRLYAGHPEAAAVQSTTLEDLSTGGMSASGVWWHGAAQSGFGAAIVTVKTADGIGLWVGAPDYDLARGQAQYFAPGTDGLPSDEPALIVNGLTQGDRFASSITACPDWTGDGLDEIVWSAPRFSAPTSGSLSQGDVPTLAGAVFVSESENVGNTAGTVDLLEVSTPLWGDLGDSAGVAVACDADLTGDGRADLVVGAPYAGELRQGHVYVVQPPFEAGALMGSDSLIIEGSGSDAWLGTTLATADLDGGGLVELLAGSPGFSAGRGAVFLYSGADLSAGHAVASMAFLGPDDGAHHFGANLRAADIDADELKDLVVGSPDWDDGEQYAAGLISIWLASSAAEWPQSALSGTDDDHVIRGDEAFQRVGEAIAVADFDGDASNSSELVLATRYQAQR